MKSEICLASRKKVKISFANLPFTISIASFFANVLFIFNQRLSYVVIILQVLILAYLFLKQKYVDYLGLYFIFLGSSMEFGYFLGTEKFYGFKNFRFLGLNLGIIALLPIFLVAMMNIKKVLALMNKRKLAKEILILWFFVALISTIVGAFGIIINDNGIRYLRSVFRSFFEETYIWFLFPLMMVISILFVISTSKKNISKLKQYILLFIICFLLTIPFSFIFGKRGTYGNVDTLIIPNVYFICPLFLLVPLSINIKHKVGYFILCFISLALVLLYNANGKFIILLGFVVIYYVFFAWKLIKKKRTKLLFAIAILLSIVAGVFVLIETYNSSYLLRSKMDQAISMLSFWKPDWLSNMSESPRYRFYELIDTFLEYARKPYYILTGKGYLGSFKDYNGYFGKYYTEGGFSREEWVIHSFYSVHETFNGVLLSSGIIGTLLYFKVAVELIKKHLLSFYFLIGAIWFLLLYGYSVTISVFGILLFVVGLLDICDHKKREDMIYDNN